VTGFDYKWDQSIERTHIRRKDFKKQLHEELQAIPHSFDDIVKGAFPDLFDSYKEITSSVEDIANALFAPSAPVQMPERPVEPQEPMFDFNIFDIFAPPQVPQPMPEQQPQPGMFDLFDIFAPPRIPQPKPEMHHKQPRQHDPMMPMFAFPQPMPQMNAPMMDFNFKLF